MKRIRITIVPESTRFIETWLMEHWNVRFWDQSTGIILQDDNSAVFWVENPR